MPSPARLTSGTPLIAGRISRRPIWAGSLTFVRAVLSVRRQRRELAALDDHLLADIGLTRDAVVAEAQRPLWDVPDHWLQK